MKRSGLIFVLFFTLMTFGGQMVTAETVDATTDDEFATFDDESSESQDSNTAAKLLHEVKEKFHLKLYLDFMYEKSLGSDDDTSTREADISSFNSNHTYLLINATPSDKIRLGFDIQFSDYYEIEYFITPNMTIKGGKIFLPFGDFLYHPIYGGKVYSLDNDLFPKWFTDYGLAFKHNFLDTDYLNMTYEAFISNGFRASSDGDINMNSIGYSKDNNEEKAVGGRVKINFLGRYNLTGSAMFDQWSDADAPDGTLLLWAADLSTTSGIVDLPLLNRMNLKVGYLGKHVENDSAEVTALQDYDGAGVHLELSAKPLQWLKLAFRMGGVDANDNIKDKMDQRNYNLSAIFSVDEHLDLWAMYQQNQERYVDEIDNDYFALKAVLQY
ncbi:MAG: hypothetical protein PVJ84_14265 [Desulfobacteraceae bacterium]